MANKLYPKTKKQLLLAGLDLSAVNIRATLIDAGITQAMLMTDVYQQVRDTKGSMTSVDLRVRYLRPLSSGFAECEASIPHLGKRIGHASAVVRNAEGKEIALGDSMIMVTLGG